MAHAGHSHQFDPDAPVTADPALAAAAVDAVDDRCGVTQPVQHPPLVGDQPGVRGIDGAIGAAGPHRHHRPDGTLARRSLDAAGEFGGGRGTMAAHPVEGLGHGRSAAGGDASDDRAAGEDLGTGGKQRRRHGPAGRQPGDVDLRRIEPVRRDHRRDHLPDRLHLAMLTLDIAGLEPVETPVGIVAALLFGEQQGKAVALRQLRPARPMIISRRRLQAAVQHDHQRRTGWQFAGDKITCPQPARIAAKVRHVGQPIGRWPAADGRIGRHAAIGRQPRNRIANSSHTGPSSCSRMRAAIGDMGVRR